MRRIQRYVFNQIQAISTLFGVRNRQGFGQMEVEGMVGDNQVHFFFNGLFGHFGHQVQGNQNLVHRGRQVTQEQARVIPAFGIMDRCQFVHENTNVSYRCFHVKSPPIVLLFLDIPGIGAYGWPEGFFPCW